VGRADHSPRGVLPGLVFPVSVISDPRQEGRLVTLGLSSHENKTCSDNISTRILSKTISDETHTST